MVTANEAGTGFGLCRFGRERADWRPGKANGMSRLAIQVVAATDRGTRLGVAPLGRLCRQFGYPAVFFFAMGPDRMGRTVWLERWRRRGKGAEAARLVWDFGRGAGMNGVWRPGPPLARSHGALMRRVREAGFEVGVAGFDYDGWRRRLPRWPVERVRAEINAAVAEYQRLFGSRPRVLAAPDWQCSVASLRVNDEMRLLAAFDTRGQGWFLPSMEGRAFQTPQAPVTLPPLEEVRQRVGEDPEDWVAFYRERIRAGGDHLMLVRAELEGLRETGFFETLLGVLAADGVAGWPLIEELELSARGGHSRLPREEIELLPAPGRRGRVAFQASAAVARPAPKWHSRAG
ncbi:MAG: hypothetical protein D6766_14665 [Verrucomicrobia bacterium]|nr:MAG: hypothetical protein D6766_14665 [Verrucomicrobiota bacterium]